MTFEQIGVGEAWIERLKLLGIKIPTAVQNKTIPLVLGGEDVLVQSPTGTGKTFAYLLPLFQRMKEHSSGVALLVIVPTRELCIQVAEEAKKIAVHEVLAIYGGQETQKQLKKIKKGVEIVIATPGRLLDHLDHEALDLSKLKYWVIDEVDQMLHLGFRNEVEALMRYMPQKRQTLCFSATIDSKVKKLAYKVMTNPVEIEIEEGNPSIDHIEHRVITSSDRWKTEALLDCLNSTNPFLGIIFCRTIRRVEKLDAEMKLRKYNCAMLHGDMSQNVRSRVVKQFREADLQFLVTTDLASRGLDISGVTHIYNFDMPESVEVFTHRVGRTGRMGEKGIAYAFVTPKDEGFLQAVEVQLGKKLHREHFERPEGFVDKTHDK